MSNESLIQVILSLYWIGVGGCIYFYIVLLYINQRGLEKNSWYGGFIQLPLNVSECHENMTPNNVITDVFIELY